LIITGRGLESARLRGQQHLRQVLRLGRIASVVEVHRVSNRAVRSHLCERTKEVFGDDGAHIIRSGSDGSDWFPVVLICKRSRRRCTGRGVRHQDDDGRARVGAQQRDDLVEIAHRDRRRGALRDLLAAIVMADSHNGNVQRDVLIVSALDAINARRRQRAAQDVSRRETADTVPQHIDARSVAVQQTVDRVVAGHPRQQRRVRGVTQPGRAGDETERAVGARRFRTAQRGRAAAVSAITELAGRAAIVGSKVFPSRNIVCRA